MPKSKANEIIVKRRKSLKSAEQRARESHLRAARRNPFTRRVIAQKVEFKARIDANVQLKKDFEFLVNKTGWNPGKLLHRLYWDSNMMHADTQTVVKNAKNYTWPVERKMLEAIHKSIFRLAEQLEQVNKTSISPARKVILRNSKGIRLSRKDEMYLLDAFDWLPEILRFYGGELKRDFDRNCVFWEREKVRWRYLVDAARRDSLYEEIRLAAPDNKYYATRLLRLVNTSRAVQKLPPIEERAFIVWLNRLRRRSTTPAMVSPFQPPQVQTTPRPQKQSI